MLKRTDVDNWNTGDEVEWCRQSGCEQVAAVIAHTSLTSDIRRAIVSGQPLPPLVKSALQAALTGPLGPDRAAAQLDMLEKRMLEHKMRVAASRQRTCC